MESVEKTDDDSSLKVLIELAESTPKFLRPQLEVIFQVCIKVSQIRRFNLLRGVVVSYMYFSTLVILAKVPRSPGFHICLRVYENRVYCT